jgi:hypothetical protein
MSDLNDTLLVEEYKSCRELILKNIDIMEKNEIYVTGACAAIFVFSLQASDHVVSRRPRRAAAVKGYAGGLMMTLPEGAHPGSRFA